MAEEVEFSVRAQILIDGEWITIDESMKRGVILTENIVNVLARWIGWFEASGFAPNEYGLCSSCLWHISEQGHSSDCMYAMSKSLLGESKT